MGNILSFSITAALARKCGAAILLRIDDIDQTRADSRYIRDIFDTLHFLDIPWDEGPRNEKEFVENYSQLHRMVRYNNALAELAEKDLVFACACSRRELVTTGVCLCREKNIALSAANVSWRLITDSKQEIGIGSGRPVLWYRPGCKRCGPMAVYPCTACVGQGAGVAPVQQYQLFSPSRAD
jgi:glutamyl-tRNA synthetase